MAIDQALFMKRLREARERRGFSKVELARRAGLNYNHYIQIENGTKEQITVPTFISLAKALNHPLDYFFDMKQYTEKEIINILEDGESYIALNEKAREKGYDIKTLSKILDALPPKD